MTKPSDAERTYSPGPWRVDDPNVRDYGYDFGIHSDDDWCIADICSDVEDIPAEANARLISAAPELLEALKDARDRVTHKRSCQPPSSNFQAKRPCKCGRDELLAKIDAAIAKATGAV